MKAMRRWDLSAEETVGLFLASDARLTQNDYLSDQIWRLKLGTGDSPALALQTQYGGRAGLMSIVPMFVLQPDSLDANILYQYQDYATPPTIRSFAPNFMSIDSQLTADISITHRFWAMTSNAIGCESIIENKSKKALPIRMEVFGHLIRGGKEEKLHTVNLPKDKHAIFVGKLMNLEATILLESGNANDPSRPRIGKTVKIGKGKKVAIRWLHVGTPSLESSILLGQAWLKRSWANDFKQITQASQSIPKFQTGQRTLDRLLAISTQQILQGIIQDDTSANTTLVARRVPETGFSRREDGSSHPRSWRRLDPMLAYVHLPFIAQIAPNHAKAIFDTFINAQDDTGFIPLYPTAQDDNPLLCLPILSKTALNLAPILGDDWIKHVIPSLSRFIAYWLKQDVNSDGIPEWQDEQQMGFMGFPTFASGQSWAQGLDVNTVQSPDLLAYLYVEAESLSKLADSINDKAIAKQASQWRTMLGEAIQTLWQDGRVWYRDRDTGEISQQQVLLTDGAGDEIHTLQFSFDTPTRLMIQIEGGMRHVPAVTCTVNGLDRDGNEISSTMNKDDFVWQARRGIFTTQEIFSFVNSIECEGLSRVYKVSVFTPNLTDLDINHLMPLWGGDLDDKQVKTLIKTLTDSNQFADTYGIRMLRADADNYPSQDDGLHAIWGFWQVLMWEALEKHGENKALFQAFDRYFDMLEDHIANNDSLGQMYDAKNGTIKGEDNHLAGIVPMALIMRWMGINIKSESEVVVYPNFIWNRAVTTRQHGVAVRRTRKGISIKFESGKRVDLDSVSEEQTISDSKAKTIKPVKVDEYPAIQPKSVPQTSTKRVMIDIEYED